MLWFRLKLHAQISSELRLGVPYIPRVRAVVYCLLVETNGATLWLPNLATSAPRRA